LQRDRVFADQEFELRYDERMDAIPNFV